MALAIFLQQNIENKSQDKPTKIHKNLFIKRRLLIGPTKERQGQTLGRKSKNNLIAMV